VVLLPLASTSTKYTPFVNAEQSIAVSFDVKVEAITSFPVTSRTMYDPPLNSGKAILTIPFDGLG